MSTRTIKGLRHKAQELADEEHREAAAQEARQRWKDMRETLASTADHLTDVAEEQWDHARHAAEEQWEHARDLAKPKVKKAKKLKKKATKAIEEDLDRLREDAGEWGSDLRSSLVRVGMDLRDASRNEADRVIAAVHESAEQARKEEHKRRVRALVGWTVFGMVAGAVLATQLGPKGQQEAAAVEPVAPEQEEGVEGAEEAEQQLPPT